MLHKVIHRYYLDDRALFAGVMTICAMASARARDGALFPGRWDPSHFQEPTSEAFFAVAKDCIPRDLGDARGLDYMRACALLALVGIQYGRIDVMHQYLGLYHSLVVLDGLHDETRWPPGLGIVEIEERRRLVRISLPRHWFSCRHRLFSVLVNVHPRSVCIHHLGWRYSVPRSPISSLLP